MTGYRAYITYILESTTGNTSGISFGGAIHCNYIKHIDLDNLISNEINIKFNSVDDFNFLNTGGTTNSGFLVDKISMIIQIIDLSQYENESDIVLKSDEWKKYDVTDQIADKFDDFNIGDLIKPINLVNIVFKMPVNEYENEDIPNYTLDYLSYPSSDDVGTGVDKPLTFGDEQYFIGNVSSDIAAIAYTMDLEINLLESEFNSTNNETWDGESDVYISEIGIYDDDENLVGIGKLNKPIKKNSSTTRTIAFQIDF